MAPASTTEPELVRLTEGRTGLWVPASEHDRGPKRREGVPFYNPAMRLARDVSVLMLAARTEAAARPLRVLDAMAALGARGLRLANEVPGTRVQLNDANPASIHLAQRNAKELGLKSVDFRVGRLESHAAAESYDWVDIDPFGTPAPFIDAAVLGVEDGGVLAVTATDTATLSGVYPDACLRRYNATPRRGACMPELATRILTGAIARSAGRRDRGARPLLAYAADHFVRAYVEIGGGPSAAQATQGQLGYAVFGDDHSRAMASWPGPPRTTAGPLWTGPLVDPALLAVLGEAAAHRDGLLPATLRLVDRMREEASAPPLYIDIEEITRGHRDEAPRLDELVERLRSAGHRASRTHFSPRGIKTTASGAQIRALLVRPA